MSQLHPLRAEVRHRSSLNSKAEESPYFETPEKLFHNEENTTISVPMHETYANDQTPLPPIAFPDAEYRQLDGGVELSAEPVSRHREHKTFNSGPAVANHFIETWIGTPPQRMLLTVSTISRHTVIGCGEAEPDGDQIFNNDESMSFERFNCEECSDQSARSMSSCTAQWRCQIHGVHDQSSWSAFEARDLFRLGGPESQGSFIHTFGCQTKEEEKDTLGIVSMSSHSTSFHNQMYNAGRIDSPDFSLCFNPPGGKANSGLFTLGGYNHDIINHPMVYAENTRMAGASYSFHIRKVYLRQGGGASVVPLTENQPVIPVHFNDTEFNAETGAVFDVETPYTLFHQSIEDSFRETWREMTGMDYTYSTMYLTDNDAMIMPTILIQLRSPEPSFDYQPDLSIGMVGLDLDETYPFDILLAIPPTQYLQRLSSGLYRTRISLKNDKGSVLGANLMSGRLVHFGNPEVGFAEIHECEPSPTMAPSTAPSIQRTAAPTKSPSVKPTRVRTQQPTFRKIIAQPKNNEGALQWVAETNKPSPSLSIAPTISITDPPSPDRVTSFGSEIINNVPQNFAFDVADHEAMGFFQFYCYAGGFVVILGIGLIILSYTEKHHKKENTYKTNSISL